jgi:hypothetical protein
MSKRVEGHDANCATWFSGECNCYVSTPAAPAAASPGASAEEVRQAILWKLDHAGLIIDPYVKLLAEFEAALRSPLVGVDVGVDTEGDRTCIVVRRGSEVVFVHQCDPQ